MPPPRIGAGVQVHYTGCISGRLNPNGKPLQLHGGPPLCDEVSTGSAGAAAATTGSSLATDSIKALAPV